MKRDLIYLKTFKEILFFQGHWIVKTVLALVILGFTYILLKKPTYESQFNIVTSTEAQSLFITFQLASNPLSDINTNMELLKSEVILKELVNAFNLRLIKPSTLLRNPYFHLEEFAIKENCKAGNYFISLKTDRYSIYKGKDTLICEDVPYGTKFENEFFVISLSPKNVRIPQKPLKFKIATYEKAITELKDNIKVKQVGKSLVINVKVRAKDPVLSKSIADSLLKKYCDIVKDISTSQSRELIQMIDEKIKNTELELKEYQNRLAKLQDSVGPFKFLALENLGESQGTIFSTASELEINRIQASISQAIAQVRLIDTTLKLIENKYADLPLIAVEYQKIKVKLEALIETYKNLTVKYYEALALETQTAPVVTILTYPEYPLKPVSPKKKLTLILSFIIGMILGTFIAVVRYTTEDKITSTEELELLTGKPCLITIPHLSQDVTNLVKYNTINLNSTLKDRVKVLKYKIDSIVGKNKKIFTIVSPSSNEGKTTIAIGLALSYAEAGFKTLIIDCNLENPSVSEIFNLAPEVSLKDYLVTKKLSFKDTEIPSIFISRLCTHRENCFPLEGIQFEKLKAELLNTFDIVIFDTSAILASSISVFISSFSDLTLLVARYNFTKGENLIRSMKLLPSQPLQIGLVLNDEVDLTPFPLWRLIKFK
ncbi:MAG: GNVR domain-containing protein [candidate division WOR-3 bacterium]